MTSRIIRRVASTLLIAAACRNTNLEPPPPPNDAEGIIVFASDRADNNAELYAIGADGRGLRRLTRTRDANDRAPALSPDGSRIAWERERTTVGGDVIEVEIWTMRADGSEARAVISNGSFNRSPSWTPSGGLVFSSRITGSDQLFYLPPGATEPIRLTTGGAADQFPRVSASGAWIVFQSNRGLDFDIYVMPLAGGEPRNVTALAGDDRFPVWTPDGAAVVWTRFTDETLTFDIWRVAADGTGASAIVATQFNELMPSVSPDGRSVVFQSDQAPPYRLFVATIRDGVPSALAPQELLHSGSDQAPWWGPAR